MSETITVDFSDIMGDVTTYTAFLRAEVGGALLNTSGDVLTETAGTGIFSFTLDETRVASAYYMVRIYSGSTEVSTALVYAGVLYPAQTRVDKTGDFPQTGDSYPFGNKAVILGTVDAGVSSTTTLTPSALSVAVSNTDQLQSKILTFDIDTITQGLRGQSTDIITNTSAALPLITFTALTTTPVSGDSFRIT